MFLRKDSIYYLLVRIIAQATTAATFTRISILIGWKTLLIRKARLVATLEVTCVKNIF